jgi:hypothetical protein
MVAASLQPQGSTPGGGNNMLDEPDPGVTPGKSGGLLDDVPTQPRIVIIWGANEGEGAAACGCHVLDILGAPSEIGIGRHSKLFGD